MSGDPVLRLQQLKAAVEKARTSKAQLEGRRDALLDDLRKRFPGLETLEDARTHCAELEKRKVKLQAALTKGIQELEADYEW